MAKAAAATTSKRNIISKVLKRPSSGQAQPSGKAARSKCKAAYSDGREIVGCRSLKELSVWLQKNHRQTEAVWLEKWKQGTGSYYIPQGDIVKELLCWGWIDSTIRKLDEQRSIVMVSPRRKGSVWSRVNKVFIQELEVAGRMKPSGQAKVANAKSDKSWNFLDDVEQLLQPTDLKVALKQAGAKAVKGWEKIPKSRRKGFLYRLKCSKAAETRQKCMAEIITEAIKRSTA
mmetsp:Transcript_68787/g.165092  ORF Transcript_68787/g.165092 Transcript_68787/m.165092 type:complete len:231 (+) Transcript_68787:98-790(+)